MVRRTSEHLRAVVLAVLILGLVGWALWPAVFPADSPVDFELPTWIKGRTPDPSPAAPAVIPLSHTEGGRNPTSLLGTDTEASAHIRGMARFPDGSSIDRPLLVVAVPNGTSPLAGSDVEARAWTDGQGNFSIGVGAGVERYDIWSAGIGVQAPPIRGVRPERGPVEIIARPLYGIRFRLCDESGAPIQGPLPSRGVSVTVNPEAGVRHADIDPIARALLRHSADDLPGYVDAQLAVQSGGLPSVMYAVSDSPYSHLDDVRFFTGVAGFEPLQGKIDLPRVSVPLASVDMPLEASGAPLGSVHVRWAGEWRPELQREANGPEIWFWSEEGDWFRYRLRRLSADGERIPGVPHGTYDLQLRPSQGAAYSWSNVVVGEAAPELEVDLASRGGVTVGVQRADGSSYLGTLRLTLLTDLRADGGGTVADSLYFRRAPYHLIYQEAGAYELRAAAQGLDSVGSVELEIKPGQMQSIDLELVEAHK